MCQESDFSCFESDDKIISMMMLMRPPATTVAASPLIIENMNLLLGSAWRANESATGDEQHGLPTTTAAFEGGGNRGTFLQVSSFLWPPPLREHGHESKIMLKMMMIIVGFVVFFPPPRVNWCLASRMREPLAK